MNSALRWIALWVLVAAGAILSPRAFAQTTPGVHVPLSVLIGNDAAKAVTERGATVSSTAFGPKVTRAYDAIIKDALGRARAVPLTGSVTIPKARVSAGAAALCIAFPARCIGPIAAGLAAGWLYDAVSDAIMRPGTGVLMGNCQVGGGGPVYSESKPACEARIPTHQKCGSNTPFWVHESGTHGADSGDRDVRMCNEQAGAPGFCGFEGTCFLGRFNSTGRGPAGAPVPATSEEINQSFTTNSANWQDTTFAAVFADAITKGATWPITTFDGAEMVGGPQPEHALATTTTTGPAGTQTQTQKSQAVVTTTGTTAGTAEAVIVERVTTTTTGPAGTTTEVTDRTPETEDPQIDTPPQVDVQVEFPEVNFSDTELPAVPDLYEQKYPDGFAGVWAIRGPQLLDSGFISSVRAMFPEFGSGGTCPVWIMDLNFGAMGNFGQANLSPPCWIWSAVGLILLTTACFTARRIMFGG